MAVLNDIRALFAQCPALKDLEARTDKLETDAEGYLPHTRFAGQKNNLYNGKG